MFKDNTSVGGLPLTAGAFPELLNNGAKDYPISKIDAIVVSRALESGAIVHGTSTCEFFSLSPLSFTNALGPVQNPWHKGHTIGGSSSGAAALVALSQVQEWRTRRGLPPIDDELGQGVDMAVGGDQGGSVRIPASYAGIYGLKPTHGLIPYTGAISLHPMIDHLGPMTKTLEDAALLLSVLAGYDGIDPRMTPESPLRPNVKDYSGLLSKWIGSKKEKDEWTPSSSGRGLRVGVIKESLEVLGLSEEVNNILDSAAARFRAIGATVSTVSIPMHLLGPLIWTVVTRAGIGSLGLRNIPQPLLNYPMPDIAPPELNQQAYETINKHNPAVVNMAFNSTYFSERLDAASVTAKAMMHAHELRAAYDTALQDYDVLLTPVNPRVTSPHPGHDMSPSEKMKPAIGATLNTCQFNFTGHPALSMPAGFGRVPDGEAMVPVGMQLISKRFDEETLFKVAAAWEMPGSVLD